MWSVYICLATTYTLSGTVWIEMVLITPKEVHISSVLCAECHTSAMRNKLHYLKKTAVEKHRFQFTNFQNVTSFLPLRDSQVMVVITAMYMVKSMLRIYCHLINRF